MQKGQNLGLDITKFFGPGIYCIKCKKTKCIYVGESELLLQRFASHIIFLNIKIEHSDDFIRHWFLYGRNEFEFLVLELGPEWEDSKKRRKYETIYIQEFQANGYNLYNERIFSFQPILEKGEYLSYLYDDVSFLCCEGGIYVIENVKTKKKYIGQAKYFAARLHDHLEWFDNKKKEFLEKGDKTISLFQKDLILYGKKGFNFYILHYGLKFNDYLYRKEIETKYIKLYIDNLYNSFTERNGRIESINKKTRDMSVYTNKGTRYATIQDAKHAYNIKHDRQIRIILDDPDNNCWQYGRSYGRISFTKYVKLIVYKNEQIFFNLSLAEIETGLSGRQIERICKGNNVKKGF